METLARATVPFLCAAGHHTIVHELVDSDRRLRRTPECTICSGRTVVAGINDLHSFDPAVGAEIDEVLSRCTAIDVSHASSRELAWTCPVGHRYWATVNNRVLNHTGCPWCYGRVLPGVTDLTTTHPHVAAELDDSTRDALHLTANSEYKLHWKCGAGHTYSMRVVARVKLDMCPECQKERNATEGDNLTCTHPDVAKHWHPARHGDRRPEHFTHGSRETMWWICDFGHEYPQRIERRTKGIGCSVCARRRLVPGVTDLASQEPVMVLEFHPYKNGPLEPREVFPSDTKFHWRCLAANHLTHQTVQHRRQSFGCTECDQDDRILAKPLKT
ncbi:zinc-ribbon domain-containing protein [Diaminobutyricibacter sp. McL0618]|uniref:zinc-ribbon domain-containing protein n=1 Tax=Leifsonia sp. McL0618 TaxID=3415677 RepID=UPI003CF51634